MPIKSIIGAIGAFFTICVIIMSVYTVDEGERGVILRNGAFVGTAEPGLGFKLPFFDSVKYITVQSQARVYTGVDVYSKDQQSAKMDVSVSFRVPTEKVQQVYGEYGSVDGLINRLLDRHVQASAENVFGQVNAVNAIQDRARLMQMLQSMIQTAVIGPIYIESVQIENIDFSPVYEKSIEDRMLAEVEVQKVQQNALREKVQAEIKVIQAKATADATIAAAEAEAQAIQLKGLAEAKAINARGQALRDNPALIALVSAEKWDGKLPSTMVPNGTLPFVNVDKK